MAAHINNAVYDAGLNYLKTNGTVLHILSGAVTAYSGIAAAELGKKTGVTYTGPTAAGTSGRKVAVSSDFGSVTANGTATHFAITNGTDTIYVCQELNASQVVTTGNPFSLAATDITLHYPVA